MHTGSVGESEKIRGLKAIAEALHRSLARVHVYRNRKDNPLQILEDFDGLYCTREEIDRFKRSITEERASKRAAKKRGGASEVAA